MVICNYCFARQCTDVLGIFYGWLLYKHTRIGNSCCSPQQILFFHKLSNCCCCHISPPMTVSSRFLTSSGPFFRPSLSLKLSMSCLRFGWLVQTRNSQMWSGNVGFSWSRMFPGFHGYREILCSGAELSVSITKRLISIKVLVQEEVLELFRSAGSCATEEQSKCVIAVIS